MPLPNTMKVHNVCGTGGFTAANRWDSNADVEPQGTILMSRIVVFSPVRLLNTVVQNLFLKTDNAGGIGWYFSWRTTQRYRFYIDDGSGTLRNTELIPTVVPQENECIVLIGSYDEAELVCYAKGESATSGPYVGFLPNNQDVTIGARPNGTTPALDFIVLACLATDTYAFSVAECATAEASIIDDLEQGRYINLNNLPGVGWNWYWDARDVCVPGLAPATWTDRISNVVLNKVGEPQSFGVPARF